MRRLLRQGKSGSLLPAGILGCQAASLGLETLDVARIHEQALKTVTPSEGAPGNAVRELSGLAETFFTQTIVPIEATHRAARKADLHIDRLTRTLRRRAAESFSLDERLTQATAQREAVEARADTYAVRRNDLLAETQRIQGRLRDRMHAIMAQREGERKRLGDGLRNEIVQALLAIDLSLQALNMLALKPSRHIYMDKIEKSIAEARRFLED